MPKEANLRFSAAWQAAERKARSARALLEQVPGSEGDAAALLRDAWRELGRARSAIEVPGTEAKGQSPGVETSPGVKANLPVPPAELSALLESEAEAGAASPELVLRALGFVDEAAAELGRGAFGWRKYRLPLTVLACGLVAGLIATATYKIYDALGPSVWLARVYPDLEFKGNPEHLAFRNLQQDWGRGLVTGGVAASGFSARFDSCLRLNASTKVRFWVESKGAANLYVDGRKLITNWNMTDTPNAKGKTTTLEAGNHHVSLDLVNQTGAAILHAQAAVGDGDPSPMDHHWFERPVAWPEETAKKAKATKDAVCAK